MKYPSVSSVSNRIRLINLHSTRHVSDSATVSTSENFFSTENRSRVMDRLRSKSSSVVAVGDQKKIVNAEETENFRQAAVLVPLVDVNGVASILFTVRSSHLSMHRGEISFPGGSVDKIDGGSAEKAALREAEEEIGIDPKFVDVWGPLPPTFSRMGETLIKPFVGVIRNGVDMSRFAQPRHDAEVWDVFTQELSALTHRDNLAFTQFRAGYSLPIFYASGYRIWGLTAIILHNALKILVPDLYRPVVRYVRPLV